MSARRHFAKKPNKKTVFSRAFEWMGHVPLVWSDRDTRLAGRLQKRKRIHIHEDGGLGDFVGVAERERTAEQLRDDGAFRRFE